MSDSPQRTKRSTASWLLYALVIILAIAATGLIAALPNRSKVIDLVYRGF